MKKTYDVNIQQIKNSLREFCADFSANRNTARVKSPRCEIYVRAREFDNVRELTLATIDIDDRLRGKGFLTEILDFIETELDFTQIRIESILSSRLANYFESRDYKLIHPSDSFSSSLAATSATKILTKISK